VSSTGVFVDDDDTAAAFDFGLLFDLALGFDFAFALALALAFGLAFVVALVVFAVVSNMASLPVRILMTANTD
jgi:hypothetical protein